MVIFSFVDTGLLSLASFATHLLAYGSLFSALPLLRLVYIATRSTHLESARNLFLTMMHRASNSDPGDEALRYFTLRKLWEAKQYGKLSQDDLEFLNRATKQFNDAPSEIRYYEWVQGRVSSDMVRAQFRDLAPKQEVPFCTELVDGQTALFEPKVSSRVARSAVTKVTQSLRSTFGRPFQPVFGAVDRQGREK